VLAQWKDHNYYPGHVICPGKRAGRYTVAFEDGDVLQVMTSHLILCDLVRVGEDVFAETSEGWSEQAVIQGHYHDNGGQGYLVKFHTGVEARFVGCLCRPYKCVQINALSTGLSW